MIVKPYVRPDVEGVLAMLAAQEGPLMHEVDAATARQMMLAMKELTETPRGELADVKDLEIDGPDGNRIPLRIYRPADSKDAAPVLVFYHGGGWVIGDLATHDSACAEIARLLGMTVVSVDYRLAPEHKFPAAPNDCEAATRWVAGSPAEIGHPVTGLVLSGDSAGGNLAAITSQALAGKLPVPIMAQWLIYPAVDMTDRTGSMEEFAEGYLLTRDSMDWFEAAFIPDGTSREHPRLSPLKGNNLADQPPTLVFTCGLDPLRDQGRNYASALIQAGVPTVYREAAGQIHGSLTLRQAIPSAQDDLKGCIAALGTMIAEQQGAAA
ncbi:MAG: alpha/beta hydrolase [Pacificimonas sp.]